MPPANDRTTSTELAIERACTTASAAPPTATGLGVDVELLGAPFASFG
jgi:hypothetical protein